MTVLGKILVFVNLVFALLTAGLIVMVYSTRTNWASAFAKEKATVAIVRAQQEAEFKASEDTLRSKQSQVDALQREKTSLTDRLTKEQSDLASARQEMDALKAVVATGNVVSQSQVEEMKLRKEEVENAQKLVREREQKIADIDRQLMKQRDEAVSFRIQFESAKTRNEDLLRQNQALQQELTNRNAQGGGSSRQGAQAQRTPVPEDFRGTIRSIQGDLATITPGSDAGAAVGAELHVYRLQPRPEYLGKLIIQAVTPHEAVGRLEGPAKGRVKANDEVAAQLR